MTLVVAWIDQESGKLWCAADTRISNQNGILTDSGPKVFEVPVVLNEFCHVEAVGWKAYSRYTFGFAFAGSALAALATHLRTTSCTVNLRLDRERPIESQKLNLARIAMLYGEIGGLQIKEMCSRMGPNQKPESVYFKGLVFGYCPLEKRYRVFILEPRIAHNDFVLHVGEVANLVPDRCIVIGSGAGRFFDRVKEPRKENEGILELSKSIVDEEERVDVGGYLQVGICSEEGFKNVPIVQAGPSREGVEVNFLGYDISRYRNIVGFEVGYFAIHIPDPPEKNPQ
ncbi:hypothetical protein ACTAB9_14425 [Pseudomonas syringae]|uniref:hypothetical protein n=1 Tax=Pseudomonas syringae TaxID=317 RepID=UPI003F7564B6